MFRHLLRLHEPVFTAFYDNGTDTFGHYYWKYYEPALFPGTPPRDAKRYGSIIPDYYRLVDRELGTLLDHVDPSSTILVCSDHGHQADTTVADTRVFPKIEAVLEDLKMDDEYYGMFLGAAVFIESMKTDRAEVVESIKRAAALLESVRVVENGDPVFVVEVQESTRIELRFGPTTDATTQHLQLPGWQIAESRWGLEVIGGSGTHRQHGILYMRGPAVRAGYTIEGATLLDIAPTLQYIMGRPLSREFGGRVLETAIESDFWQRRAVTWVQTYPSIQPASADLQVDTMTREKLRALGYLR